VNVTTTLLGILGFLLFIAGFILILAGVGIITIKQPFEIARGAKAFIAGLVIALLGALLLLPEVRATLLLSPTATSVADIGTSSSPSLPTSAVIPPSNVTTADAASAQATVENGNGQTVPTLIDRPLCYGVCWDYDDTTQTMTWTRPADGTEDIWQPPGEALQKIRGGYTAIFNTSVPGEIFACVLTVNEEAIKSTCDGILHQIPAGAYRVTSANQDIGGFRWCPAIGYGWRANGGECK
jgi:hypothetical protein